MFGSLWLSEPQCKENDFDIEAHIKKEEFLRHQLLKERKSGHESVSKVKKQNQDLKLHAKLALTGLQERIRALEDENVKLREEKSSYLGSIKESVEEMLATVRHNGNDKLSGGDTRARDFATVSEKLLNGLSQLTDQKPPKEAVGARSAVETSSDSYEIPQAVLDSLENQNITSTLHESGPKTPNRVRSIVQRFELSREEGARAWVKGGDDVPDRFGENCPTPNGDLGSPSKVHRNQQKITNKNKSAKKDRFFPEDSMELSKTQGLDHELRQKDEEIRDLTEQLAKANNQIASLQQDLQERKSSSLPQPQQQPQPQPQPQQAVYLDDLLDVEKFQNQIFATCALSLLFTLVLLGIVEANEVVIGQSTDLSISQIKDDNGRSQRVLDFPQTVDLSVCDGDCASRPLSVDDLSTNRQETLLRTTSSSAGRRSLSYSLEKEIFKKTIQLFTDRNSQLLKENDDMRRKVEREVSKRRRLLMENATLFDRLSRAKRRDLKPVVCEDSCQTDDLPTETKEVQCESESVQESTVLEEKLKSMKKAMKERAAQSIEKIKSLQQEIGVLTNQNDALTVQLQHVESKTFESQVELQEAKQQYRTVSEEKRKLKDNYRSQMKEYQKQYDGKCREVKKLQDMLISDKEKFRKLRDSMKKIAHLKTALFDDSSTNGGADDSTLSVNISNMDDGNVTLDSQSSSSRCGIPDLELHRMYSEEIRKRIDVKDKAEEESLLSELSLIDEHLQGNLRACKVTGGEDHNDQNDHVSKLWDRLKSLQDALEAKQDECAMMQEELIFLRSKVHLYEVLNANSVSMSGSPLSPHSRQSLCISPMLLDDEPSLHRDRKGEIRMLRLKIMDLEAMLVTLQQEKETMKSLTASLYPKSSTEANATKGVSTIDSMHEAVVASLERAVHEWREKYEAMKGTVDDISADRLFYRNELETERRNTLNLLAELCRLPNQEYDQTNHSKLMVSGGDISAPFVAVVEELAASPPSPNLPAEEKQKLLVFYDALYSRTMHSVEGCIGQQDKFESF